MEDLVDIYRNRPDRIVLRDEHYSSPLLAFTHPMAVNLWLYISLALQFPEINAATTPAGAP
jgi:hypothetical protein